jgi:hypothetical protein
MLRKFCFGVLIVIAMPFSVSAAPVTVSYSATIGFDPSATVGARNDFHDESSSVFSIKDEIPRLSQGVKSNALGLKIDREFELSRCTKLQEDTLELNIVDNQTDRLLGLVCT